MSEESAVVFDEELTDLEIDESELDAEFDEAFGSEWNESTDEDSSEVSDESSSEDSDALEESDAEGAEESDEKSDDDSENDSEDEKSDADDELESEDDESEDEDSADEGTAEEEETKPPKGFVSLNALHEARDKTRYWKDKALAAEEKLEVLSDPALAKIESFKELSDEELQALAEEDPAAAAAYAKDLRDVMTLQAKRQAEEQQLEVMQQANVQKVNKGLELIESLVPRIYDEKSDAGAETSEFLLESGFTDDMFAFVNPATQYLPPGEEQPRVLGPMAADMLGVMLRFRDAKPAKADVSAERESLKAELRKEVEAEVMSKLKDGKLGKNFRSTKDIPARSSADGLETVLNPSLDEIENMSDADFMKLVEKANAGTT